MSTYARAAVAGNPSDGFGGAVCALVVPAFSASVALAPQTEGAAEKQLDLLTASIARFTREVAPVGGVRLLVESTIPRLVGLAGSSAIVIDAITRLAEVAEVELSPMRVAQLAHTVERRDLGIAGGWQDQLIQSHGFSALMDFRTSPSVAPLRFTTDRQIPMYLAWSTSAAQTSGAAHGLLQAGPAPDPATVRAFASAAHSAAEAFRSGDVHALKLAIDRSFDLRAEIMELAPEQERMVEVARDLGASANYAGSGGAIVGVLPKNGRTFLDALNRAGYETFTWDAA